MESPLSREYKENKNPPFHQGKKKNLKKKNEKKKWKKEKRERFFLFPISPSSLFTCFPTFLSLVSLYKFFHSRLFLSPNLSRINWFNKDLSSIILMKRVMIHGHRISYQPPSWIDQALLDFMAINCILTSLYDSRSIVD